MRLRKWSWREPGNDANLGQAMHLLILPHLSGLMSEIEVDNQKFMEAFAKHDATALSMLYTEDCKLMPTGTDVLFGSMSMCGH